MIFTIIWFPKFSGSNWYWESYIDFRGVRITVCFFYSTVIDCLNKEVKDITKNINYNFNSLILDFTISIKTSNLTKTSHYTVYQQKLYEEVKRLKEIEGYGYRRISYILYEKGFRSIRTDSILKNEKSTNL